MEKVFNTIKEQKMFKSGTVVGVGVSGGSDSMALLHFLNSNKEELDIEVIAIHIDHCLRETSGEDAAFVARWCRENHIRLLKFKVDVKTIAETKKNGIEAAAREARYGTFDACIKKGMVDLIATAHHQSDQAETVLMHILRGSGLGGARGMDYKRGYFIRPFLNTTKDEILNYVYQNHIEYVDDETNSDIKFARNLIRNKVMPILKKQWPNAEANLANFADICKTDDDYINQFATTDGVFVTESYVKIPLSYFSFPESILTRIIIKTFVQAGLTEDYEKKHIDLVKNLAKAENGSKLNLPQGVKAFKEYEYVTLVKKPVPKIVETYKFKCGKTKVKGFGNITIKKTDNLDITQALHMIDCAKLPKNAIWRTRQEGDFLAKFGGGTKKLRSYLIDKKIPQRLRDSLPVLAVGSEILIVAGLAISSKLKISEETKQAYAISYEQIG